MPNRAVGRIFFVCGSRLTPFAMPLSGPLMRKFVRASPILLNMIVVITSLMPRTALRTAGTRAQSAPPSIEATTTTGMWMKGGRCR